MLQKKYAFTVYALLAIEVFPKVTLKKNSRPHFGDPPGAPQFTIFLPQDVLHVKRPQISGNKKWSYNAWFVGGGGPVSPSPPVYYKEIIGYRLNNPALFILLL